MCTFDAPTIRDNTGERLNTSESSHTSDEGLAAKAKSLGCAALVDAMMRVHGHRAHILSLASPSPTLQLFGPAVTISYMPYRDDLDMSGSSFSDLFYEAIGKAPAGNVLVLSSGGFPDVSHGGDTKLSRVANHNLAEVLADGRLRDFDELREYGFAAWCRGEATRWGGDTVIPYAANVAVEVAGVCVIPGDYVCVDASGGVVIPAGSLRRVLDEAARVDAEDAESTQQIRGENLVP